MITFQLFLTIVITVAIFVLFITEKYPVDVVALLTILLLVFTGIITPEEAVSGFSNPATITILAMFIISEGLQRSGFVRILGEKILNIAKTYTQQLLAVGGISSISAFINNTPTVAIIAPMVMDISRKSKTYATQLLIPLSFISMAAGTLTLIGSSSNILGNNIYVRAGYESLNIFEISKMGIFVFLIVVAYFLTIGKYLLPKREGHTDITDPYNRLKYNADVLLPHESPLIGKKIGKTKLKEFEIEVFSVMRDGKIYRKDLDNHVIRAEDILVVYGTRLKLMQADSEGLIKLEYGSQQLQIGREYVIEQFMIAEGSSLIHQTISSMGFVDRYQATVLALKRANKKIRSSISSTPLKFTDILLVKATNPTIELMKLSDDFVYIGEVAGPYRSDKIKYAIPILLGVVLLAAFNIVPIMIAALTGVLLMTMFRVVSLHEGYKAINWQVIFLLAGIIPLGIALEKTGFVQLMTDYLISASGYMSPTVLLGMFCLITMVATQFIANNAAIILFTPIAISVASQLGLDPMAFVIVIMFAAATPYLTPVSYQTNVMVYQMGNYKFTDFIKVGLPLNIILLFATTLLASWIWGF